MADIPVYESTAETVVVVTANGQATFNFDFLILFPEQMTVFHGRGDVETVLTYPADFSVSGLDQPNGGTVTLNAATLANDVITMRRVTPIERTSDWQAEGDYKAALVNREQDTIFMIMQEISRDTGKAVADVSLMDGRITLEQQLRIAADTALGERVDKEISDRANAVANEAYLREAGDKSVASLIGQAGPIETQVYDTQTAAALSTVKPTIQSVRTGGFFAAGDGGGALYKRSPVEPDHEGKFQSADGAWWELAEDIVTPLMMGAKGDGVADDIIPFQNAMAFGKVHVPSGVYKVSDAIELPSDILITGEGTASKISTTGTNRRVLVASGKSRIAVRNLFIEGNLTGEGSTGNTAAGGDGIAFHTCTDVEVSGCVFSKIGNSEGASYVNCIRVQQVDGAYVHGNLFLEDCGTSGNTGADISLGYYTKNTTVTNNVSRSDMDTFISVASVGMGEDTTNHVITGNRGYRAVGSVARHGILAPYNGRASYAVISNNLMLGFHWCGIYVSAGASDPEDEHTAGVAITGNIIRYCSGGSSQNISAGIYVSGHSGATCTGNLIEHSGFDPAGDPRANEGVGIKIANTSRDIVVSGNVIKDSKSHGVLVANAYANNIIENISIVNNIVKDSGIRGISAVVSGSTNGLHNIDISGNQVISDKYDVIGIYLVSNSSATDIQRVRISGNTVISSVSAPAESGIVIQVAQEADNILISGNMISGFYRGIQSISYLPTKFVGEHIIIDGNTIENCQSGLSVAVSSGAGSYALHFNTTFINCNTEVNDNGRVLASSRLGSGCFEIRKSSVPADGAWVRGDKVLFTTPTASGNIGAVCVAAGSPGTWKNYGSIEA